MLEPLVSETYAYTHDNLFVLDAQIVGMDDTNVQGPWILPLLLGKDVNGNDQRWQIGFDGANLVTQYGRVGGQLQTVSRAVITNTSGRDIYQQSLLEGKKRFTDKCMEGYHAEGTNAVHVAQAMLANKYTHTGSQLSDWPVVYYQPKIDGIRCLISNQPTGIVKVSRKNKTRDNLKHLDDQCRLLISQLPTGVILDGELYRYGMKLQDIASIVNRTKNLSPDEHLIQYWIFDLVIDGPFEHRYQVLYDAYHRVKDLLPSIVLVPIMLTERTAILDTLDLFVNAGYEGLVLRKTGPNTDYKAGRCSNILKVKKFDTAEGLVINVIASTGTEADCAMFILYDADIQAQFPVRPCGSFDQRRIWLQYPEQVIGKLYTYKYFSREYGNPPRFPTGVGFRDYE